MIVIFSEWNKIILEGVVLVSWSKTKQEPSGILKTSKTIL